MSDLLPINATPQERAISDAIDRPVPVVVKQMWNPDTCPASLLPWLAWAFSVDAWDTNWTEAQKRGAIKASVAVHQYKGTIGAIREALASLQIGAHVQEWFVQSPPGDPYTFRVILDSLQAGVSQSSFASLFVLIERSKNLRSHIQGVQVNVIAQAGPYCAAASNIGSEVNVKYVGPPIVATETTIAF